MQRCDHCASDEGVEQVGVMLHRIWHMIRLCQDCRAPLEAAVEDRGAL